MERFSANAKFLITGEYAVLANITALAVPLKRQQHLEISSRDDQKFTWKSYDADGSLWFEIESDLGKIKSSQKFDDPTADKLLAILRHASSMSSRDILNQGFDAVTTLDFNRKYGMGTSSTLISLIAQWADCDAYQLQFEHFGGSGFDIACATAKTPILYNYNDAVPIVKPVIFNPAIKDQLFFVYLNQKQNSRDSIAKFDPRKLTQELKNELNQMPNRFVQTADSVEDFSKTIERHEEIISNLVGLEPVKNRLFPDYKKTMKSLGGWGGDFILVVGDSGDRARFRESGYSHIYSWDDLVLTD
ncbi:hypothetical protein BST97_11315 [Nonlabens spongiae]|uniref:GHMP kinase n=1 Tax=Nonlabens spongiae TaxID=331648 RepID=A0A1W6MPH8_9FLAO|nr:hypothetical protein BST97_11315 [Nonlabens spongiae]